jgi:hypothetical protein
MFQAEQPGWEYPAKDRGLPVERIPSSIMFHVEQDRNELRSLWRLADQHNP